MQLRHGITQSISLEIGLHRERAMAGLSNTEVHDVYIATMYRLISRKSLL